MASETKGLHRIYENKLVSDNKTFGLAMELALSLGYFIII